MQVFIHLNHGSDQSYLLTFPKDANRSEIRSITEGDFNKAVKTLMGKANATISIPPKDRMRARVVADFVLTDG